MLIDKGAAQVAAAAEERADSAVEEKETVKAEVKKYEFIPYTEEDEFDWKKLTAHKIAKIFPPLEGKARKAVGDDIEERGLIERITIYKGEILDGWTRFCLCLERDIELTAENFREFIGDDEAAEAFAYSANEKRRHLAALKERIKYAAQILKKNPKLSDRTIGKKAHVDHKTVGAMRKKPEVGNSPRAEENNAGGSADSNKEKVTAAFIKAFKKALKAWDDEGEFEEWIEWAREEAAAHFHPEEVTGTED